MSKILIYVFLIVTFSSFVNGTVYINEILPNPEGSDSYSKEFIELYSNESNITLENWKINDSNSEGDLLNLNFSGNFLVLDGNDYGFFLTNDGETLYLYDNNNNLVDSLTYSNNEVIENKSIGRFPDGSSNIKVLTELTPGFSNKFEENIVNDCDIEVLVETNSSFLDDLDFKVKINKIYGQDKFNVTLEREIINSNFDIAKKYDDLIVDNILNHRTLSYSPNLVKGEAYLIKAKIKDITCNDINNENNYYEKLVYVRKSDNSKNESNSKLEIEKISPDIIKFGDIIKIDLNIYRGNTRKYAIKLWGEGDKKISDVITIHANEKFTNYDLQIPLKLYDNCENKFKDGKYELMLEGLDESEKKEFNVKGMNEKLCKIKEIIVTKNDTKIIKTESKKSDLKISNKNNYSENIINDSKATGLTVFQNSNEKAMRSAIYLFALVVVLILIGVILKKNA